MTFVWPDGIPRPTGDPGMALAADGAWRTPSGSGGTKYDIMFIDSTTTFQLLNAALGGTEYNVPRNRVQVDLAGAKEVRAQTVVTSASAVAASVRFQYSTDGGTTWKRLASGLAECEVSITATGLRTGVWLPIDPGAVGDVLVRWIGLGDGVVDPIVSTTRLQVR